MTLNARSLQSFSEDPRVQAFQAAALKAEQADRAKRTRHLERLEAKVEEAREGLRAAMREALIRNGPPVGRKTR